MANILILLALCVLPAIVLGGGRPLPVPYKVHGGVYCDTCKLGCEHKLSTPIAGATVKIECRDRDTQVVLYSRKGVTGSDGKYTIEVSYDHEEEVCDVVLVSSPQKDCAEIVQGLERARVIVTNNNGIISNDRNANNLGFRKDKEVEGCDKLVKLFSEDV